MVCWKLREGDDERAWCTQTGAYSCVRVWHGVCMQLGSQVTEVETPACCQTPRYLT